MKKPTTSTNRNSLNSNSRRRQLLKRVQHKTSLRRQHFQIIESSESGVHTY